MKPLLQAAAIAVAILTALPSSVAAAPKKQVVGQGVGNQPLGPCNSVQDTDADATACIGYVLGNDHPADVWSGIDKAGWSGLAQSTLTQFKDGKVAPGAGSDTDLFDVERDANDGSAGRLTLLMGLNGPFVLTLKGGNEWAAYYYGQGAAAGTQIQFNIPGSQGAGLSHASVYAAAGSVLELPNPPAAVVPEPGTPALILAALGAAGWTARRRRR